MKKKNAFVSSFHHYAYHIHDISKKFEFKGLIIVIYENRKRNQSPTAMPDSMEP